MADFGAEMNVHFRAPPRASRVAEPYMSPRRRIAAVPTAARPDLAITAWTFFRRKACMLPNNNGMIPCDLATGAMREALVEKQEAYLERYYNYVRPGR